MDRVARTGWPEHHPDDARLPVGGPGAGRDLLTVSAWLSVGLVMIPVLLRADPGGVQFGFRYAQDIYPFVFVLLARTLATGISFEAWLAILVGVLVNAWGMGSAYFDWWYRS